MSMEILNSMGISKTQKRVLALLMKGMANDEIASTLFVTVSAVKHHVEQIYKRSGCPTRARLIVSLFKRGWKDPHSVDAVSTNAIVNIEGIKQKIAREAAVTATGTSNSGGALPKGRL